MLRRHPAWLAVPGFVLVLCLLTFYVLPPWGIPVWLIVIAAVALAGALVATAYRQGSRRRRTAAGIRLRLGPGRSSA